jgi:hypothetical protein
MDQGNPGIPVKNPRKPRFIRVICRHTRSNPGWQTHEFPNRLMIRYSGLGRRAELSAEHPVRPAGLRDARYAYPGRLWEPETYQYRCPRCRFDLQLRAANMMRLISALVDRGPVRHGKDGQPETRQELAARTWL